MIVIEAIHALLFGLLCTGSAALVPLPVVDERERCLFVEYDDDDGDLLLLVLPTTELLLVLVSLPLPLLCLVLCIF